MTDALLKKPDAAEFVRRIFAIYWPDCQDIDGDEVQAIGVQTGVLVETKYDPAIHGPNDYDADPGDVWYVLAPALSRIKGEK